MQPSTRDTIAVETGEVLSQVAFAGGQYVLRLRAPQIAAAARPGGFVHLRCDPALPMRRPMSIMRTDPRAGWIEILYKVRGLGTRRLSQRRTSDAISLVGPIGVPFKLSGYRHRPLLIGGGVGVPPIVFLAEHLNRHLRAIEPFVLIGSELPFPFQARPSAILVPDLPPGTIATMPLLEDWGIACRLSSGKGFPGCFDGLVTDLARHWLSKLEKKKRAEVELFACGPTPMLRAVARLGSDFQLPCQISVEEFMACAVGGCAGCAVRVLTPSGPAMKRVCVDGPVFEAESVFPA